MNSERSRPSSDISLIAARWIVPIEPRHKVLEHHCVVLQNSKIIDLLPRESGIERYPTAEITELSDHVLLPGFINAHGHAAMSLLRGIADDLNLQTWLNEHIWPIESRWVDSQFVRDGTELAIAEMISGGTTMFADMYFYPDVAAAVAQEAGMRACIGLMVMDFPTVWGSGPDEYFEKGLEVHDEARSFSHVTTMLTPHAPYTVSDDPLQKTMTYADELQVPLQMHIHESAEEVADAVANSGIRPLQRLDELGLLNPRMLAVHMTELTDSEVELVAHQGVHVIHCPKSNAKLGNKPCRTVDLLAAGANVALGTDGAASNNSLDMLGELQFAALLAKQQSSDASALPAWQALEMATLNGAKAFNMQDCIGSIVKGKFADLCAIDLSGPLTQPVYDPISQVVYSAGRDQVTDVWIQGKRILKHRVLQTLDIDQTVSRARQWRDKIIDTN